MARRRHKVGINPVVGGGHSGVGTPTLPGAPTSPAVTTVAHPVFSWTAPSSSGTDAITNYKVYRGTTSGGETLLATVGNVLTYTDSAVTPSTTYYYKVAAVTAVGTGPQSSEVSVTVPALPGVARVQGTTPAVTATATSFHLALTSVGTTSALLVVVGGTLDTVTGITDNASTHYTWKALASVTKADGGITTAWVGTGGSGGSVTATVALSGSTATYAWMDEFTNALSAAPVQSGTAGNNTETAGSGTSFTTPSMTPATAGCLVYNIVSSEEAMTSEPTSPWVSNDTLSYQGYAYQTGVSSGTGYTATFGAGSSGEWTAISLVFQPSSNALPGAPTGLGVTNGTSLVLNWAAPSSSGTLSITNYQIWRGGTSGSEVLLTTVGDVLTYTDSAVTSGDTYYYKVAAYSAVGAGPLSSEASGVVSAGTLPGAPTGLGVTNSGPNLTLSWTAPASSGSSALEGYKVYRGTTSGGETLLTIPGGTGTSVTDDSAAPSTTYYYKVAAYTSVGTGPMSNEASGTTPAATAFSLFASDSLWKTTKTGVTFASAATSTLAGISYGLNNSDFCHPFFKAQSTDPLTTFVCGAGWGHDPVTITCPAPAGMAEASGGDADMCVLLPPGTVIGGTDDWGTVTGQWLLDMYGVTGSGTAWTATYYGLSDGLDGPGFGTQPYFAIGTTAIGSPQCAGTILATDVEAGVIPHGLTMAFDYSYLGGVSTGAGDQVPPAVSNDDGGGGGPLPEGGLLLIPPGTAMPGGLSTMGKQLWIAAQTYGCYITDQAGGGGYFYGDGSAAVAGAFTDEDIQTVGENLQLVNTWS